MRKQTATVLSALLLASYLIGGCCQDEDPEIEDEEDFVEEKAFLLTRKSIVDKDIVVGKNLTVQIEIHNAGTSSALDVQVEDVPWPSQQFAFGGGSLSASFPRITAGSTATFTYFITPLSAGFYSAYPARTTYRDMGDATEVQMSKSSVPHLYILTTLEKFIASALTVGSYLTLGSLRTLAQWQNVGLVAGALALAFGGRWAYTTFTDARKRSKYQRALEEVNKYQ